MKMKKKILTLGELKKRINDVDVKLANEINKKR